MSPQKQTPINTFVSLHWYDETIRFIFNFVAKTSELLLAAGVVISSANFLTDGAIMQDHTPLSVAWAWAQAIAIDSSLGIVFVNGFQSVRDHDKIKAAIYFVLTAMLATVAGLLTHFDALAHATGSPVTSQSISGIIPLWVLTGLRAVAVIGFLLVSRLKNVSFNKTQEQLPASTQEQSSTTTLQLTPADYNQIAMALMTILEQNSKVKNVKISEETTLPPLLQLANIPQEATLPVRQERTEETDPNERIAHAYAEIKAENEQNGDTKSISARKLASRAKARRSTCNTWLQTHGIPQKEETTQQESIEEAQIN